MTEPTAPDTLTQELTRLRAEATPEALQEATRLEREAEAANPENFDLGDETREIPDDGSAPPDDGTGPTIETTVTDPVPVAPTDADGEPAAPPATEAATAKAVELNVDLSTITDPSGATGAITVKDVEAAARSTS